MESIEYLKERARMTKCCRIECEECKLSDSHNGLDVACEVFEQKYPEKAVAIVEQWSKEHPKKTYKSVFLEKFPQADIKYIINDCCPDLYFGRGSEMYGCDSSKDCLVCWDREYKEND